MRPRFALARLLAGFDALTDKGDCAGAARSTRGGSCHGSADACRSASRGSNAPVEAWGNVGFRVALDPAGP